MIHNMKKRISNIHWWFIISNACILLNLMYCSKNTSKTTNVVNTRTNICYTYGCHTRTNHKENRCHSCISNPRMTYCYHHHVKPSYKAKSFKENQCIVTWGHATSQVGGNVKPQKDHILFISPIPFVTLFLFFLP